MSREDVLRSIKEAENKASAKLDKARTDAAEIAKVATREEAGDPGVATNDQAAWRTTGARGRKDAAATLDDLDVFVECFIAAGKKG